MFDYNMEELHSFNNKICNSKKINNISSKSSYNNRSDEMVNPSINGNITFISNDRVKMKFNELSNKRNRNGLLGKGNNSIKQSKNDSEIKSNSKNDINTSLLNGNDKYYSKSMENVHYYRIKTNNINTNQSKYYSNKHYYRKLSTNNTKSSITDNNYESSLNNDDSEDYSSKFIIKSFSDLSNVYETSKTLDKNLTRWIRKVKSVTKKEKPLIESSIKRFKTVVNKAIPNAEIVVFGSYSSALRLPDGDVDLTIRKATGSPKEILKSIIKYIKPIAYNRTVHAILNARTPIIRYVDAITGIKIDVNASPDTSISSTNVINKWIEHFPPLKLLIQINKYLIRNFDLHDTALGGVGSFLLFHMCFAFYLKFGESCKIKNNYSNGFAILCLWKYYGDLHNYHRVGIGPNGDFIPISTTEQDDVLKLVAYSPVNDGIEFGKRAHQIPKVIALFKHALSACLSINKANVKSSYCDTLDFLFSDSYNKYINKHIFS